MRRGVLLIVFSFFFSSLFGEIKVKIVEPLRFRDVNQSEIGENMALAIAHLEVYTDNKNEDLGKRVKFNFPPHIQMTNRKKWLKIEKIKMDRKNNEVILEKERELVKVYALLDRRDINKGEDIKFIEGEYVGRLPIIVGVYSLKNNRRNY